MTEALADLTPIALGMAVSPIPLALVMVLLLTPRGLETASAFLAGWVIGVTVVVVGVAVTVDPVTESQPAGASAGSVIDVALGLTCLTLAARSWRRGRRPGSADVVPHWMRAVDRMTARRALALALLLSAINPKNLTLGIAGGTSIGSAALSWIEAAACVGVFTGIASLLVAAPVAGVLLAGDRVHAPLLVIRQWLTRHATSLVTNLLVLVGALLVWRGLVGG